MVRQFGVPPGWQAVQLGSLANVVGGGTPSRNEGTFWSGGEIPWATPTDLTANPGKYIGRTAENITEAGLAESGAVLLPIDTVLFTSRATIGECAIAECGMTTNQGFANFMPLDSTNPEFLYYLLHHLTPVIKRLSAGTTFNEVSKRELRQVWCAVPEAPEEQAAIARILDAVDAAIERTKDAIYCAQELRRSLLQSLLSVGLGHDGPFRDQSCHEFAVYRHGRFPQAWRPSSVGAEFDLQTGFTLNESRRPRYRARRYLRVANVQRDHLSLGDVAELEARDAEFEHRRLEFGDLLVVEGHADRMQIGRCAAVSSEAVGLTFQNHLFRLRTRGKVIFEFAVLWLNSEFAQRYWNARCATSSGLNTINQRMLLRMFFPVPDEREQSRIIDVVQSQRRHLEGLTRKQRALDDLKRSLMHDLLTGKVRTNQLRLEEVVA